MRGDKNKNIDTLANLPEIIENSTTHTEPITGDNEPSPRTITEVIQSDETTENSEPNFNKIANDLVFRFGENNFNKSSVDSSEFANSTNSENSGYITANQMDKIIEQLNTYSDDKGLGNFTFNDMQNSVNLQIYG